MTLFKLFSQSKKEDKKEVNISELDSSKIWMDGFRAGFDKAWSMIPELRDDVRKKIESQAIDDTLRRLNGNILPKN